MILRLFEPRPAPIPLAVPESFENLRGKTFLFGLGAQKAGSTWLSAYLERHPQIAISPIKELHVWNQYLPFRFGYESARRAVKRFDFLSARYLDPSKPPSGTKNGWENNPARLEALRERMRMGADPSVYLHHFDRIAGPEAGACAEITPEYALLPAELMVRVRNFLSPHFAAVKPVFLMRDPVDRLWSNMKHDHRRGRGGPASETWRSRIRSREALDRSRYDMTCANLEKAFPREDILYLFYEDLFTVETLSRLCAFLGVDYHPVDETFLGEEVKKGVSDTMPADFVEAARRKLDDVYVFARRHFGDGVPASWRF